MKLNLNNLRITLRNTLISIWEYVIPIWKISGLFKRIKSKQDLENFIQERSAHVTQTTLYGYLKTRIGVKYIAMMEDERFLKSINLAKWNIYVVALADCAFYVFSYLISEKNLKDNDCKEIFLNILENEKENGLSDEIFENGKIKNILIDVLDDVQLKVSKNFFNCKVLNIQVVKPNNEFEKIMSLYIDQSNNKIPVMIKSKIKQGEMILTIK